MRYIVTVLLLLAGSQLLATPSTLLTIPSTDIQPKGVWHLGADSVIFGGGAEAAPASFVDVGLTYGMTSRLEVGIDLVSGQDNPLWGNAKYQLLAPESSPLALAVGVYNAASSRTTNQQIAYVVGSTTVSDVRFTLGGYAGRKEALAGDDTGILAGIDLTRGKWWYGADYAGGKNAIGSWNVGIGYALTEKIGVIVGYDNYHTPDASDGYNIQFDVNL